MRGPPSSTLSSLLLGLSLGGALALAAQVGAPEPGAAQEGALAAAEAAYGRGALREAQRQFAAALRQPERTRAELARIHVHLGILAAASGAERTARTHFAIALALEPTLPAPPELAGRDRSRFEQERPRSPLALTATGPERAAAGSAVEVAARVTGAPEGLVQRVTFSCGGAELASSPGLEARATVQADQCGPGDAVIVASALDAHGHVLLQHEVRVARGGQAP